MDQDSQIVQSGQIFKRDALFFPLDGEVPFTTFTRARITAVDALVWRRPREIGVQYYYKRMYGRNRTSMFCQLVKDDQLKAL